MQVALKIQDRLHKENRTWKMAGRDTSSMRSRPMGTRRWWMVFYSRIPRWRINDLRGYLYINWSCLAFVFTFILKRFFFSSTEIKLKWNFFRGYVRPWSLFDFLERNDAASSQMMATSNPPGLRWLGADFFEWWMLVWEIWGKYIDEFGGRF